MYLWQSQYLPTIILRHKKENKKKCSLTPLEIRKDFLFFTYPKENPHLGPYLLLTLNAPSLTLEDQNYGLFLIDATWRYASIMEKQISNKNPLLKKRSLPCNVKSAYPRKQTFCCNPTQGLASIETLYFACLITKRPINGLLNNYYWKEAFLEKNKALIRSLQ